MNVFGLEPVYGHVDPPQVHIAQRRHRVLQAARTGGELIALAGLTALGLLLMRR